MPQTRRPNARRAIPSCRPPALTGRFRHPCTTPAPFDHASCSRFEGSVMYELHRARALRAVLPQPELEDGRIQLLATMLGSLGVQT